eukprot:Filipodium_phascolosomae@DN4609_c0_g1_i1.p1
MRFILPLAITCLTDGLQDFRSDAYYEESVLEAMKERMKVYQSTLALLQRDDIFGAASRIKEALELPCFKEHKLSLLRISNMNPDLTILEIQFEFELQTSLYMLFMGKSPTDGSGSDSSVQELLAERNRQKKQDRLIPGPITK